MSVGPRRGIPRALAVVTGDAIGRVGRVTAVLSAALALALALLVVASSSHAQRTPAATALTLVVGPAPGAATTDRLDSRRTNASPFPLPTDNLRIVWTRQGAPTLHPPLVLLDGTVVVVVDRGDALFINRDGTEHSHVGVGPGPMSAPTLLSDGTVAAVNGGGEVIGLRAGGVVFRTRALDSPAPSAGPDEPLRRAMASVSRLRGGHTRRAAPAFVDRDPGQATSAWSLSLDDGGLVVAMGRSLVCLDAVGVVRARATAPWPVDSDLLAVGSRVAFVSAAGEVYAWDLASPDSPDETLRLRGTFGGAVDGSVAVEDGRHLLGIVDGARLVSLDVVSGESSTRSRATQGAFTAALALASVGGAATAYLEEMTLSGTSLVAIDHAGHASPFPSLLSPRAAPPISDAALARLTTPTHTVHFVDPSGAVAYGTVDGRVGVATMSGKVELASLPCGEPAAPTPTEPVARFRASAGFAGIVPAGPRAFVVACESGAVSLVRESAD